MKKIILIILLSFSVCLFAGGEKARLNFSTKYQQANSFGTGEITLSGEFLNQVQFETGTDTKQINAIYCATGTVSSASYDTINFQSLTDFVGSSLSFSKIKVFCIKNTTASATLSCGGTWLATETIELYGSIIKCYPDAGISVVATSSTIVLSATASTTYELFIAGIKN